jgi:hypothetical protein
VFDESGLTAPRRAFEHYRHAARIRRLEKGDLVTGSMIVRLVSDAILIEKKCLVGQYQTLSLCPKRRSIGSSDL